MSELRKSGRIGPTQTTRPAPRLVKLALKELDYDHDGRAYQRMQHEYWRGAIPTIQQYAVPDDLFGDAEALAVPADLGKARKDGAGAGQGPPKHFEKRTGRSQRGWVAVQSA